MGLYVYVSECYLDHLLETLITVPIDVDIYVTFVQVELCSSSLVLVKTCVILVHVIFI